MRKVLSFSLFLMAGLLASQLLPGLLGDRYAAFKTGSDTLLYVCLAFIMINVGREFEIDRSRGNPMPATTSSPWPPRRCRGC